ncbi:MAG: hypothetical protein ACOX2A_06675 [Tepidanaerobacteraceae bacterium]|jgi:hypothetical protein|nr:hypothetical protein [Thermoanaerobacterales bacterium]
MKKAKSGQKSLVENAGNNIKPQPNPYTLFLILILLINSFGGLNSFIRNIKNILMKTRRDNDENSFYFRQ